jgi:uncharacterized Rmd1/YagE family protein
MASASTSERTPLLGNVQSNPEPANPAKPPKPKRTVTFDTLVTSNEDSLPLPVQSQGSRQSSLQGTSIAESSGAASRTTATDLSSPTTDPVNVISTINNKLRRRNSQTVGPNGQAQATPGPKIGPQRTTKVAEKLKILPSPDDHEGADDPDEESGREVYSQFTRIKDPTARSHAARLGRADRTRLPRVTAYCTAGSYRMTDLMRWLKAKGKNPKLFDECIYATYSYDDNDRNKKKDGSKDNENVQTARRYSDSVMEVQNEQNRSFMDLNGGDLEAGTVDPYYNGMSSVASSVYDEEDQRSPEYTAPSDIDIEVHTPEVFLFSYGTLVVWGMTVREEKRFLKEIAKFEVEKLAKDDVQTEDFNFYYTREYQARIYNDFISLQDKKNYMNKLAISHALSQSVKVSWRQVLALLT